MNLVTEELENGFSTSEGQSQSILPRMSIPSSENPFAIYDKPHSCVSSPLSSTLDVPASHFPMALNLHQYAHLKTIPMKTRSPVSAGVRVQLWRAGLSVSTHGRLPENAEERIMFWYKWDMEGLAKGNEQRWFMKS